VTDDFDDMLNRSELSYCWRCLRPAPNEDESDAGWTAMQLDGFFVQTCPDCFEPDGYEELSS
jgi:hypothetical protein